MRRNSQLLLALALIALVLIALAKGDAQRNYATPCIAPSYSDILRGNGNNKFFCSFTRSRWIAENLDRNREINSISHEGRGNRFQRKPTNTSLATSAFTSSIATPTVIKTISSTPPSTITYHVSPTGNDKNPGTLHQPFATIARASSVLKPGDQCIIHAGTYRETIRPDHSGTTMLPITYRAAGDGPVVVSGADIVNGWRVFSGGIYEASLSWDLGAWNNQVLVNGQMMVRARFPNAPYDRINGFDLLTAPKTKVTVASDCNTMYVPAATQPANFWVGSTVWSTIYPNWTSDASTVLSSSPGMLKITKSKLKRTHDKFPWTDSGKGILIGTLAALDAPGEWHIQNGKIYLKPHNGNLLRQVVEVKRRQLVADLSIRNSIIIDGLQFTAGAIRITGSNSVVKNSVFKYVTQTAPVPWWYAGGLEILGSNNILENCLVDTSSSNGIILGGSYNVVRNCIVRNVSYNGDYSAAVALIGDHNTVEYSTLSRSGRILILANGTTDIIRFNDVSVGNLLTEDAGLLYTVGRDGQGTEISYNWFHGDHPEKGTPFLNGIYLDNGSTNFRVHHNVAWNNNYGIFLHGRKNSPTGHQIHNNTIWDNFNGGIRSGDHFPLIDVSAYNNLSPTVDLPGADKQNNLTMFTPRFVDAANRDYRLQAGSPAIDHGRIIPGITDGYKGACPDIGAYEYSTNWSPGAHFIYEKS